MHNYESAHGALPPVAATDKDGRPLLSWRVLILPYIEHQSLYDEFHLDEPWDSPHNIALLDKMPATYRARSRHVNLPPYMTYTQVFVGPDTPFERGKKNTLDFPRGTSNTFLIVEAGESVLWTKPVEIEYDPSGPFPKLGGVFPDVMRAVLADGSRIYFPKPLDENEIRGMIPMR